MSTWLKRLNRHKFSAISLAFLLMVLPPVPMFYAAQAGRSDMVWVMLGLVVLGNLIALVLP